MNAVAIEAALACIAAVALFFFGFHMGGLSGNVTLETDRATQLSAVVTTYEQRATEQQIKAHNYEQEITTLQVQRTATPDLVVRLCPSTPSASVPATGEAGQVVPPATGVLSTVHIQDSPGRDVGHPLFSLADYADEIIAKCRAD